jgi:hypothetical protein
MNIKMLKAAVVGLVLSVSGFANATVITNGSFETGDFTGWDTQDLTDPFYPLEVNGFGADASFDFFTSSPTNGDFAALNGFDGNGSGTIRIGQDITVTSFSTILFDYRAAWDLQSFGATVDRLFSVSIEEAGGGIVLDSFNILTAAFGDITLDTGNLLGSINLSAFENQTVRLNFMWDVPENFSGPAFFQLDNIRSSASIPEPSTLVIFALSLMGLASRRLKVMSKKQ